MRETGKILAKGRNPLLESDKQQLSLEMGSVVRMATEEIELVKSTEINAIGEMKMQKTRYQEPAADKFENVGQ